MKLDYKNDINLIIPEIEKYAYEGKDDLILLRGYLYALVVKIEKSEEYKKQVANFKAR